VIYDSIESLDKVHTNINNSTAHPSTSYLFKKNDVGSVFFVIKNGNV
jgi:hypothetical protein